MFDNLSNQLSRALRKISGKGRLSENNIKDTIREIRRALLEADVALPVIINFIQQIKERAIGQEINKSLTPAQAFIKIMHTELVNVMGNENNTLNLAAQPPAIVLIVGPQGAGKTTSISKLGKYLREKQKKKVLVVSTDIYRPAAIKQLEILAKTINIDFFSSNENQKPLDIVNYALKQARLKFYDVLLVDTTGYLHTNKEIMKEIISIHNAIKPIETLFVVDAMTGQDSANIAKEFDQTLPLTGIILTKMDSDARGGAALSVRYITSKPIKFIGTGEKADTLELFYPDRLAGRILGMGDILSLIEDIENKDALAQSKKLVNKLKKDKNFNLNDFLEQIKYMHNIGGIEAIINKLPNSNQLTNTIKSQINNTVMVRIEAIINSMTNKERINPNIIKSSHKRRIATGSGVQVQDVNKLLKQFENIRQMMNQIKRGGIKKIIKNMKQIVPTNFPGH